MEEKTNSTMTPFCEALMEKSASLAELRQPKDTAIVLCTDGVRVASRQCGNYPDAVNMIIAKMKAEDKFAELILEASMLYSRHLTTSHELFKEDTPIVQPAN